MTRTTRQTGAAAPAEKEPAQETTQRASASPVAHVDRIESAAHADLATAIELRDQLLREIVAGMDRRAELATLNHEIDTHQKLLQGIAAAKEAAASANTKAARDARWQHEFDHLKQAIEDARELAKQSGDVLKLLAELGSRLQRISQTKATIQARMTSAIQHSSNTRRIEERQIRLRDALQKITLPDHTLKTLWDIGFGRTGIELSEQHFELRPFGRIHEHAGTAPVEQVTGEAVQALRDVANGALSDMKVTPQVAA